MEKKFKVVAKGCLMDVEVEVKYKDQAKEKFVDFVESDVYFQIYIEDIETGEVYHTYYKCLEADGIKVTEWEKIGW